MGRVLAIGDIHGCLTALDTLLGFVRPGPDDQLVFLGDYIDRGPDSKGILDRLVELRKSGTVVCLRGNHEIMMLGHTQHRSGEPLRLMRAICIDTWAYGDGWLTCLDVETGQYWQANEFGQTREGWL